MILLMVYQTVEACNQFGLATTVHPALENRELYPSAITIHQLEYLPPAPRIRYVVGDDIEMLFQGSAGHEVRVRRDLTE